MKSKISSIKSNERGIVSIIVTVVFILLMSLVVLAMSQNANKEQRQALDRQLSDQAFYNAESGINDWANYIYQNASNNPQLPITKSDCQTPPNYGSTTPPQGLVEGVNSYSCVTFDRAPQTIEFKPLSPNQSKFTIIKPASDTIRSLKFTWRAFDSNTNQISGCNSGGTLPESLPANCNVGGIRFELFKMQATRDAFIDNNFIAFVLPSAGGGTNLNYGAPNPNNQGVTAIGTCSVADGCSVILNGLSISTADPFYLNIKALYLANHVTIQGFNATGTALRLVDSQIMIDSTGKANDVLRRVQVRLPSRSSYNQVGTGGGDALTTKDSICKLLDVSATRSTATMSSDCAY